MKKENYGIPAALLCVGMYLLGLYGAVNRVIWPVLALTVAVFALSFAGNIKKTAIQALSLTLIFCAIFVLLDAFGALNGLIKYFGQDKESAITDYLTQSWHSGIDQNGFDKFLDVVNRIVEIASYVMFIILAIAATTGKGIIVGKVHMIVDGFIPVQPVAGQMYSNGQSYSQQPQQRQPMQQQPMQQQPMQQQPMSQMQGVKSRQPQQPQYAGTQNNYQNNLGNVMQKQPQMPQGQPQQAYGRPQQMYNGNQSNQMNPNQPNNK